MLIHSLMHTIYIKVNHTVHQYYKNQGLRPFFFLNKITIETTSTTNTAIAAISIISELSIPELLLGEDPSHTAELYASKPDHDAALLFR